MIERVPLVVVQAVVCSEQGQVLLAVRGDLQGWELPGGTPKRGEALEEALCRELKEETGLEVAIERVVGDYVRTGFRPHTARVFRCRESGGCLRPSRETPALRWFEPRALPDTLFPWYRLPIADAFGVPGAPVTRREHQGLAAIFAGLRIDLKTRLRGIPNSSANPDRSCAEARSARGHGRG